MADFNVNMKQTVSPKLAQRTVLLGRVKMAQAIQLPESEWAKMLSDIERDPVFLELLGAQSGGQRVIKFKRFGKTQISGQFYEMQDANVVGGSGELPEALLEKKKHLLKYIQTMGQENFEKYFLYREQADSLGVIAQACGITEPQAKEIQDFILEMSVQAEFYHPSSLTSEEKVKPTLVGKIIENEDGTFSISFFSPHLARGMYEINHDVLKRWQRDRHFDREGAARLRKYVGILELSNMKQGAFWRVIDHLLKIHEEYFKTRDITKMAPVSLREVARQLQFAPSTISRVITNKSLELPWGREVAISFLMPGQRKIILGILERIMGEGKKRWTDMELAHHIEENHKIRVSRRTITACRHLLQNAKDQEEAA